MFLIFPKILVSFFQGSARPILDTSFDWLKTDRYCQQKATDDWNIDQNLASYGHKNRLFI